MNTQRNAEAIVVGGGLAGLAISRQLHRAGIDFHTIEQRATLGNEGFAINLPGNAIAALHEMGLGEEIAALGQPIRRRSYRDHRDRTLFEVDEDVFWGAAFRPRCVKRAALLALLRQDLPASAVSMASRVSDIAAGSSGVVVTASNMEPISGRIVIGADGANSRTRALAFPGTGMRAAVLSSSSWRFIAPDPGVDCWTVWAGPDALFLLIPLGNGEVYGWASSMATIGVGAASAGFSHHFRDFPDMVGATARFLDAHPGQLHHSPLEEVRMPVWGNAHMVLIGDAAHATAPVWAQGGAMAFEDANALASILRSRVDWSGAATQFEQARRQRVTHVQTMTDKTSRAARLPFMVRRLLLPFVGPKHYRAAYESLRA